MPRRSRRKLEADVAKLTQEVKSLTARLKPYFQSQCTHTFINANKGCMESLYCVHCGIQNPKWVMVGSSYTSHYPHLNFDGKIIWIGRSGIWDVAVGYIEKEIFDKAVKKYDKEKKKKKGK